MEVRLRLVASEWPSGSSQYASPLVGMRTARVIESRSSSVNLGQMELLMPVEKWKFSKLPHRVAVGYTFGIEVFGRQVWIGELRGEVPDVELDAKRLTEGGEEMVQVFVRPTTEEGRQSRLRPLSRAHRLHAQNRQMTRAVETHVPGA